MTNSIAGPSFQKLKDSLDHHAGLLSEGYQRFVLLSALDSYSEGFRAGVESADPATGLTPQEVPTFGHDPRRDARNQEVPAFEPSLPASTLTTNTPDVILDVLRDSIDSEGTVRIDYVDRYGNGTYNREVAPQELTLGDTAVVCTDVAVDEYRQFRLDSIKSLTVGS